LRRLRQILPVTAGFFATVDPATMLFTSALAEAPLSAATSMFLDNEFGQEDVNKFAFLAASADPVSSLDRATRGRRPDSARYREIMAPLGLGDELRAALIDNKVCWGVLCLHREDAAHGFEDRDVAVIRQIARTSPRDCAGR
jgi:GAF domain-containing protein